MMIRIHGAERNICRVKNDVYGNPRYIIHYTKIADSFEEALKKAKNNNVDAKKYRGNPSGCIVITSYNIKNDLEKIYKK